ncbi:hypothetical protein EMPS_09576 [Entomortierella parvispora]|uniref:N-acetyltransferase domain-containing protein n=1 Tax=Entomortierella parvispora TaxID=205924 RepID=A0A9P3HIF1_9FUNG|nr:hypothetical protein EMPS_09576 [Entomortierella parvispora]
MLTNTPAATTATTEATATATTTSSTKGAGATAASTADSDIIFQRCSDKEAQELFFNWSKTEQWNPGAKGADIPGAMFKADPQGFFMGKVPKKDSPGEFETVSMISGVRYGEEQAWIGFYVVAPEHRGRGYGLKSFQNAMKHAQSTSTDGVIRPSVGLDGVMAQVDNYRRSGFTEVGWLNERRHGSASDLVHKQEKDLAEKISRDEIPGLVDLIVRDKLVLREEAKKQEEKAGATASASKAPATTTATADVTSAEKENEQRNQSFLGLKADALVGSDFQDAVESAFTAATTAVLAPLSLAPTAPVTKLADWAQLSPMEQKYTGLKRPGFVRDWVQFHADHPEYHRFTAAVLSQDQKDPESGLPVVLGYACVRPAESSYRVGPLYAATPKIAKQLLVKLACDMVQAEKIKPLGVPLEMDIDVPDTNAEAIKLFDGLGWPNTFPSLRMWNGKVPKHDASGVFGITTLEVG